MTARTGHEEEIAKALQELEIDNLESDAINSETVLKKHSYQSIWTQAALTKTGDTECAQTEAKTEIE